MSTVPVSSERFHRQGFVDYQLVRLYALGFARADELREAAARIRRASDVPPVLTALSEKAEAEGRLREAASYLRGAEFFTPHRSPEKRAIYERYRDLWDRAFADAGVERHRVPYGNAHLPAMRLRATGPARGTVVLFGGFDSLIEEFYAIWSRIAEGGWDVVVFEGPGQGGARAVEGLRFDHDWEKPVGAVLDHFGLDDVTLVGISMGGYWAVRAAAYEPRVTRVVAWPPVYDWLFQLPPFARPLVHQMLRWRRFMNVGIRVRMWLFPVLHHAVEQALCLCGGEEPMEAVDWLMAMNREHLSSERVTQDVLLLVGENDVFQPPKLADAQQAALTGARSVVRRTFTAEEHADRHCQMGNIGLACEVLLQWLETGAVDALRS